MVQKLAAYRRLWTVLIDAVFSIALIIIAHYNPNELEFYKAIIIAIQPVAVAIIAIYTAEDNADANRAAQYRQEPPK